MNKKALFYQNQNLYFKINKSSSDFYASSVYLNFINENNKNEISKNNNLFTINREYNKDIIDSIHKKMLHSKIKSNPKYNNLEIECYTCKKGKSLNKNKSNKKEFFLTTEIHKSFKKSRNIDNFLKPYEDKNTFNCTNYKRKFKTIYPISSTRINMNKYYFDTNKNIKEFINERRLINKLRYLNKLKNDLKEKRENEVQGDFKLLDINCISLLKSNNLFRLFETDRNHYNRHLLNELMINKQMLLKIKLKKNILEGQVINLKKKIDDLRNKANILNEFKNFLLFIKNKVESMSGYINKTIDTQSIKGQNVFIRSKNKINKSQKYPLKKNSLLIPELKRSNYSIKQAIDNKEKDKILIKKVSYDMSAIKEIKKKDNNANNNQKFMKSDSYLFETSLELDNKINKMEDSIIKLINKNNKLSREIIDMKIKKKDEYDSIKVNSNVESKIKIYEELLNSYKYINNDLNNKLNSLIKEKENHLFNILTQKKIKQILISINRNFKYSPAYENIFDKIKKLNKSKIIKNKYANIFEGIIIIEKFINKINDDIKNYSHNSEEDFIVKIKYKLDKEKKYSNEKHNKYEKKRQLKLNKILEKMNKICLKSRKVPEKINFSKTRPYAKNKQK